MVTHPLRNVLQAESVVRLTASVQTIALQYFDPFSSMHYPSFPIKPVQNNQAYVLHGAKVAKHPFPLVTQPALKLLQS